MITNIRKFLAATHFAALGLGVVFGLRGSPEAKPGESLQGVGVAVPSSPSYQPLHELEVGKAPGDSTPISTVEYAAAWDSLKGRFLPRQDRLLIEKTLLEEWSVIDLAAAVRAVLAETTDQGPNGFGKVGILSLLDCCAPGIQSDPLKAWELIRSRAFGMETGRFRAAWLDCVAERAPVVVFSILPELTKKERLSVLRVLAESSCTTEDSATRAAIWTHLSALPDTPAEAESLTIVGETISHYTPPAELASKLQGELTPGARRIYISALSVALFDVEASEGFQDPLFRLPAGLRGEVALGNIQHWIRDEKTALFLADVALDSGNLDALQAAAANPAFALFAREMRQPLALADWALRLPDDPRAFGIYRQAIEGAASRDFEQIRAKLETLPPGRQRDQGFAALAKVDEQRRAADE